MQIPLSTPPPPCQEFTCLCCGQPGRSVSVTTLKSLLRPEVQSRLPSLDGYCFCATSSCAVAYFHLATRETMVTGEVSVPIFQKSKEPERLVCYCFQHTVAEIQREVRSTGISPILTDIKTSCAQHLDDCKHTNPQGSCCLGNVQRVIQDAVRKDPSSSSEDGGCCCQ